MEKWAMITLEHLRTLKNADELQWKANYFAERKKCGNRLSPVYFSLEPRKVHGRKHRFYVSPLRDGHAVEIEYWCDDDVLPERPFASAWPYPIETHTLREWLDYGGFLAPDDGVQEDFVLGVTYERAEIIHNTLPFLIQLFSEQQPILLPKHIESSKAHAEVLRVQSQLPRTLEKILREIKRHNSLGVED